MLSACNCCWMWVAASEITAGFYHPVGTFRAVDPAFLELAAAIDAHRKSLNR